MQKMYRQERPTSCGKKKHDPSCLCDVVVKEPAPIMNNWAKDSYMSQRIIQTLRLSSPWANDKILSLLTEQVALHDDVVEYNRRKKYGISTQQNDATRVLRLGQIAAIADMYEDGWNHKEVRTYVLDNWNIELDRTNAHRIKERAEKRRQKHEVH